MATTPPKKESKVTASNDETKNPPAPTAATPTPPTPEVAEAKDNLDAKSTEAEIHPSKLKTVQAVTSEVLAGHWGPTFAAAQQKLEDAGYDVEDVWAEYQRRKAGGAPSAF